MKKARIIKRCILVLLALLLSAVALGACASSGSTSQSSSSSRYDASPDYHYTSLPTFDFSLPEPPSYTELEPISEASFHSLPGVDENDDTNAHLTVYITETGEKYHRSGCQYLRKSKIPISLGKAVERGYSRCSKCNPPRLY